MLTSENLQKRGCEVKFCKRPVTLTESVCIREADYMILEIHSLNDIGIKCLILKIADLA